MIQAVPTASKSLNNVSESSFALAIDVGNSRVSAAVAHGTRDAYDNPVLFSLSASEPSASSAVFVDEDGELFFGDEAEQRGSENPHRLVREFVHAVGDEIPVMMGGHAVAAEDLVARLCSWIIDEVTGAEGDRPALITVTHPTSWGGHRLARLRAALDRAGIDAPVLVSESEASARQRETALAIETGEMLAVYDLGGTRFDACVLRRRSGGDYQAMGEQVRIEHLGGANFDDALLRHVLEGRADDLDDVALTAVADVRREVVSAKELLSSAGDATVQLAPLSGGASVRITRSEFEAMIAADLDQTVEALDLAIESADAHGEQLQAIVLTGGSSRIPLVAQRLSERFDLPIIADADTKASTVLGAARIADGMLHATDATSDKALVPVTTTEKMLVPKPDAKAEQAGVLAFLRPLFAKPSRSTSPVLLAGAAVFIAVTIVFSSTTAAGTRWPDFVQEATSTILHLPKTTDKTKPASAPTAIPPGPTDPAADGLSTPARNDSRSPESSTQQSTAQERTAQKQSTKQKNSTSKSQTKPSNAVPKVEPTSPPATPPVVVPVSEPVDTPPTTTPPPDVTPPPGTPPADTTPPPTDTTPTDPVPVDPAPVDPEPVSDAPANDPAPVDGPVTEPSPGPSADPA